MESLTEAEIEEFLVRNLNMNFPLQSRKWLNLLENNSLTGIRIRKELDLEPDELGFSFKSNKFGLRGPANGLANTVIFGTSYAMGFAVNNGENWYDNLDFGAAGALNLGLPVGTRQIERLFKELHHGPRTTALFVYMPNLWETSRTFEKWEEVGGDVFATLNWDRSLQGCLARSAERVAGFRDSLGRTRIIVEASGVKYLANLRYAPFDLRGHAEFYRTVIQYLGNILNEFSRIFVFRARSKEEVAARSSDNSGLQELAAVHEAGWLFVKSKLTDLQGKTSFHEEEKFDLQDYHPCDTHWNKSGNAKFRHWVSNTI